MKKKKVIIDCDAGVDDALALILAFHSPELEVEAVTGVNGNVPLNLVFDNIKKVLSLIQPTHRPLVAKGADRPLKGDPVYSYFLHGRDGLGEAEIILKEGEEEWQLTPIPAPELISRLAHQYPGELTLIATGPLTNLAIGLKKDPEGMRDLKEVVAMGGAVRTRGNITPHAEFNVFVDPLAAAKVLGSGLAMTFVPLDVTHQVFLSPEMMEGEVKTINSRFSRFATEATGYDPLTRRFRNQAEVFYLHDPLAVGVVIDPGLVRRETLVLRVETQERERMGQTSEVPDSRAGDQGVRVCLGVDSKRFLELFLSRM